MEIRSYHTCISFAQMAEEIALMTNQQKNCAVSLVTDFEPKQVYNFSKIYQMDEDSEDNEADLEDGAFVLKQASKKTKSAKHLTYAQLEKIIKTKIDADRLADSITFHLEDNEFFGIKHITSRRISKFNDLIVDADVPIVVSM